MTSAISEDTFSRINKIFMDQESSTYEDSDERRKKRIVRLVVGDDVQNVEHLQYMVITIVNLAKKCFANRPIVYASEKSQKAQFLCNQVDAENFSAAIKAIGGDVSSDPIPENSDTYLILGDVLNRKGALRVTFDGWTFLVGPSSEAPRLQERLFSSIACYAAAAIAVGEIFFEFGKFSIEATRRVISFSLWRPELPISDTEALGEQIEELPTYLGLFGLGHLGQAYIWGLSGLPFPNGKLKIMLCDDDCAETTNLETGAVLSEADVGKLKTRVITNWVSRLGIETLILERRIDNGFQASPKDPEIAFSGFDDNLPRRWLANAGFKALYDTGLGAEHSNFDTIGFHAWPSPRTKEDIWPLESNEEKLNRTTQIKDLSNNKAYSALSKEPCGRVLLAGKSVGVPFVGAFAACIALSEMVKRLNGGPTYQDIKVKLTSLNGHSAIKFKNQPTLRGILTVNAGEKS